MKKTLIFIVLIVALTVGVFVGYEILRPRDTVGPILGPILDQSSDYAANTVATQLHSIRNMLTDIAAQVHTPADLCAVIGSNTQTSLGKVDGIVGIDTSNQIVCSSIPDLKNSAAKILTGYDKFNADPEHTPTMGQVFTLPDGALAISAFVPVLSSEKKYLGSIASVNLLKNIGSRLPDRNSLLSAGYIVLFDDVGDVLYHFDPTLLGKNHFSDEIQAYTGRNDALNNAFKQASQGIITNQQVAYTVRGDSRIGEFRPVPVGKDHFIIVLTSLPNY